MSLNYTQYVAELITLAVETTPPSAGFTAILPGVIDYAEQRLYRELDLLNTIFRDSTTTCTANSRNFTLTVPTQGPFVVTEAINIITPSGTTPTSGGTRVALLPASREYIDWVWPSETAASASTVPKYYGMITDQNMIFGPPPGAAYTVEIVGTIRPTPISAGNPTTYLSLYLPDLFIAASMIFISGWQKNFGSQGDQPAQAVSWESQYEKLFVSANMEENRKRYASASWTSKSISQSAVPQRG